MIEERPSLKAVFDARTCDSSIDGCDPDWRDWVLRNADPEHMAAIDEAFRQGTESEAKLNLGIWP